MHAHLVLATKNREQLILPAWREKLPEYLGGTVIGLGAVPQGIGGVEDHVHLLVHHREKSHRDELIELLERAGIEFDPKFLD